MLIHRDSPEYALLRLLGALAYEPDHQVFLFESGHVGMGFLCTPSTGVGPELVGHLRSLLNADWPANTCLQFSLWTSPDIEPMLQSFLTMRADAAELLRDLTLDRVEFLREATQRPPSKALSTRINQQQLIVTFKIPIATPLSPTDAEIESCREIGGVLSQNLRTAGLAHTALTAELYLRQMQTLLNWAPDAEWRSDVEATWDPQRILALQALDGGASIRARENPKVLFLGDTCVRLLSAKRYPDTIGHTLPCRYVQNPMQPDQRGVTWPMLLTVNIEFPKTEGLRNRWETERQLANRDANLKLSRFNPRIAQRREALEVVMQAITDGDRPIRAYLGMAVFGKDLADVTDAVTHIKSYYHSLGFRLQDDTHAHLPLFGNLLPFGTDPEGRTTVARYRHMATRHIAPLLPVYGDWQGTGTPLLTLMSRSGQPMPIDVFDTDSNMNAVIAAKSGSGKSFLTNALIENARMRGDQVVVIDIGKSYRALCKLHGGRYVDFDPRDHLCINPFTDMADYADEEDSVCEWIMAMAQVNEVLNDLQIQQLKRVMAQAWAQHGQTLCVDLIARACRDDPMEEIQRIGHQLYPFTVEGSYGRWVNGPNNIRFDDDFVVLELEHLKGQRQLQRVVLLQLMYQVDRSFYRSRRDRRRFLIIDEAWDLFGSATAAQFITKAYRRFRKYRASAVTITQSINDLYMSKETEAIAENSAFRFLLRQEQETIDRIVKESRLSLPGFAIELLRSVRTVPGEYSEILCLTPNGVGVGRLVVSEFCRQLYSTRAEDVEAIERELEAGASIRQAIERILARKRPGDLSRLDRIGVAA